MSTAITLPGGLWLDGRLARDAAFRGLTGKLEQQLATLAQTASIPVRISGILAAMLEHVGGCAATPTLTAALSVSDRQFLMLATLLELDCDQQWRHLTCGNCAGRFDVGFRLSELPLSAAGSSYPWAEVVLVDGRALRVRVPSGEDEAAVAALPLDAARRALALRCVVAINGTVLDECGAELDLDLDAAAVDVIDIALDEIAPQLASALSTSCTHCGAPHRLDLDPYALIVPDTRELYGEVHALALRYHWSEAQCLRLPRERRRMYLNLIDRSLGQSH